ncbi:BadF/BadG/BcrA/BcrD ATPase family protein [Salinimicrobium sp. TH3]|uniref:BadF/BadG/BcrA/BcrD ATPase family protein n=1 Tax=Salinimicrobium sp. TH3 TaxID=2997342 RepID=UPI002273A126|nr:BadF/BadG/BcrA/BcrD ATPase family protein [Salinimicrobium sp. TH3]MCY2686875.1 N-acetylglucosamine kinase [Salinimicrobium sp. TH3]
MILIADGGSTKCDWILLDSEGEQIMKTRTKGLNPAVFKTEVLQERLEENLDLKQVKEKVERVHFYGAGCGTAKPTALLKAILSTYFSGASDVRVQEDMVAAVYAVTDKPGIVCILGTGSNSCYYDGKTVRTAVDSLGYILMDEASGNYFGKRLIRDYYYKKMPKKLADIFEKEYDLSSDSIKENIYKKDNPNTYLAHFAEFIFKNERNGYFYQLIAEGMQNFIEHRVLCFKEAQNVPIHFVGSIAYFSQDIIKDSLQPYRLEPGNFVQRPIDGIIDYYRKHFIGK